MFKLFFALAFIFVNAFTMQAIAQDNNKYLPLSSKSDEAINDFRQALMRLHNADMTNYKLLMDKALTADPTFFMAHANLALQMIPGQDQTKADAQIDKTLALPQTGLTPAEQIVRGMIVKLKDNRKADLKPELTQLTTQYPDVRSAFVLAADVSRFIMNDNETAFNYLQKVTELDPNFGPAYNLIGYYYMDKKQMDKAKEAFDKYMALSPNEANAYDSMGEFYMNSGNFDKSAELYDKAVSMGMEASRVNADKARSLAKGEEPKDEDSDK